VPPARLFDECLKLFLSGFGAKSFALLQKYGLFEHLFPQTAAAFALPPYAYAREMLERGLANTDARVLADKPVTPTFLFAILLWSAVLRELNEAHVPCAPVKTAREVATDPHLEARGFWVDIEHPRRGKTRVPISPIRLHTAGKSEIRTPAPTLGQHTDAVLAELLDLTPDALAQLRTDGVTVPMTEKKKA